MGNPLDMPGFDLGVLHPALAGVDGFEMLAIAVVSWVGGHVVTCGELLYWVRGEAPPRLRPSRRLGRRARDGRRRR